MKPKPTTLRTLILPAILALISCTGETERKQLDAAIEKEELRKLAAEKEINKLRPKLDALADRHEKAAEIDKGITASIEARRLAQTEVETMEKAVRDNATLLGGYQAGYREPQAILAAGLALGDVTLKNGQQLKGAVVTQSNSVQVGLRHSAGIGVFPVDQLPNEVTGHVAKRPTFAVGTVEIDPMEVLRKRPDLLKTYAQQQADRSEDNERKFASRDAEQKAARDKRDEESKRLEAERSAQIERQRQEDMAAQQTRQKMQGEVNALGSQIETLKTAIIFQQRKKSELQQQWANSSIRPAPAQQQKELAAFDVKISELGTSIGQLDAKMRELIGKLDGI